MAQEIVLGHILIQNYKISSNIRLPSFISVAYVIGKERDRGGCGGYFVYFYMVVQ